MNRVSYQNCLNTFLYIFTGKHSIQPWLVSVFEPAYQSVHDNILPLAWPDEKSVETRSWLLYRVPTDGAKMLMRDSGSPRSTTRISARSTSSRPGGLLARLLLQRFLRTQTGQSTPVVFPAQTLRRSSQIWRFGERLPQILWLFRGFLFFWISFLISKIPTLLPSLATFL